MKKIQVTPKEYAKLRNITVSAATDAIRHRLGKAHKYHRPDNYMPGVVKIEVFGRWYLLTVKVDDEGKLIED